MDDNSAFRDILQDLEETEGTEIANELRRLKRSIYTVNRNFKEVNELDQWFRDQGLNIQLKMDKGDMDAFLQEYLRRYHNYVVSVYTLIKQTQRIKRADKYGTNEFDDIYEKGKRKHNIEIRWEFLQQLRHFMVKSRLPSIDITLIEEEEGFRFGIVVSRDELLNHGDFDPEPREYLEELGEEIDIQAEMHSYQDVLNSFYSWFFEALQDHREDAMGEREETIRRLEERHEELFGDLG